MQTPYQYPYLSVLPSFQLPTCDSFWSAFCAFYAHFLYNALFQKVGAKNAKIAKHSNVVLLISRLPLHSLGGF